MLFYVPFDRTIGIIEILINLPIFFYTHTVVEFPTPGTVCWVQKLPGALPHTPPPPPDIWKGTLENYFIFQHVVCSSVWKTWWRHIKLCSSWSVVCMRVAYHGVIFQPYSGKYVCHRCLCIYFNQCFFL